MQSEKVWLPMAASGTMIRLYRLEEELHRGKRFAIPAEVTSGNNDLLGRLTRPRRDRRHRKAYLDAGTDASSLTPSNATGATADYRRGIRSSLTERQRRRLARKVTGTNPQTPDRRRAGRAGVSARRGNTFLCLLPDVLAAIIHSIELMTGGGLC